MDLYTVLFRVDDPLTEEDAERFSNAGLPLHPNAISPVPGQLGESRPAHRTEVYAESAAAAEDRVRAVLGRDIDDVRTEVVPRN